MRAGLRVGGDYACVRKCKAGNAYDRNGVCCIAGVGGLWNGCCFGKVAKLTAKPPGCSGLRESRSCPALVDEEADFLQGAVVEFYTGKACGGGRTEVAHEAIDGWPGKVGLAAQHVAQGRAVGGVVVLPGHAARGADLDRDGHLKGALEGFRGEGCKRDAHGLNLALCSGKPELHESNMTANERSSTRVCVG